MTTTAPTPEEQDEAQAKKESELEEERQLHREKRGDPQQRWNESHGVGDTENLKPDPQTVK